jgi:hypothetical protein
VSGDRTPLGEGVLQPRGRFREQARPLAMDDDVAAILGLTTLELKRGVAGFGWIGSVSSSTWRLGAAAVLLPAFVAVIIHLTQLRDPQEARDLAAAASRDELMAMQAGSAAPLAQAEPVPLPADTRAPAKLKAARQSPRPAIGRPGGDLHAAAQVRQANGRLYGTPAVRDKDKLGGSATGIGPDVPERTTRPPTILQARNDAAPEQAVRQEIVTARLDAVDALRALRQK